MYYCTVILLYYCITVLVCYHITVLVCYRITGLVCYRITGLVYYCITVLLYWCVIASLYWCAIVLLYYPLKCCCVIRCLCRQLQTYNYSVDVYELLNTGSTVSQRGVAVKYQLWLFPPTPCSRYRFQDSTIAKHNTQSTDSPDRN